jgi:hypothetical protein
VVGRTGCFSTLDTLSTAIVRLDVCSSSVMKAWPFGLENCLLILRFFKKWVSF